MTTRQPVKYTRTETDSSAREKNECAVGEKTDGKNATPIIIPYGLPTQYYNRLLVVFPGIIK